MIFMLFTPVLVVRMVHLFQQTKIKREVKEFLAKGPGLHQLVRLEIDRREESLLNWEHSEEFEYLGKMYDVVEKEYCGDRTVYLCWPDHRDTHLNKTLAQLLARTLTGIPSHKDCQSRLHEFYKSIYFLSDTYQLPFQTELHFKIFSVNETRPCKDEPPPPVPPPDLV